MCAWEDGIIPSPVKPKQAEMLRALATVEHNKKLDEIKSKFLDRANKAALSQKFEVYVYPDGWTDRIKKEFMDWLHEEGFKYKVNQNRNEYDIIVSW